MSGIAYALLAYTSWGLFPAYWKLLAGVPHGVVLAHRILWSALFFYLLLRWRGKATLRQGLVSALASWRALAASALLISANWYMYIYAVNSGQVLESSLGYFINPLVNVFLGLVFLGEKLRRLQWVALALAAIGVTQLAVQGPSIPWISLFLAFSFGFYGLIRKRAPVPPLAASTFESLLMVAPALVFAGAGGNLRWFQGFDAVELILGGVVTGLPLLWFAEAATRLPLSMMGFFQYIAPSIQFLLAIFAFGEVFTPLHGRAFAFIWVALGLFTIDLMRTRYGRPPGS